MKTGYVLSALLISALLVTMLAGCGSKISKDNFDKIKTGMTLSEVEGLLGKGTKAAGGAIDLGAITGSGDVYTWEEEGKKITVTFKDDKMIAKLQTGL